MTEQTEISVAPEATLFLAAMQSIQTQIDDARDAFQAGHPVEVAATVWRGIREQDAAAGRLLDALQPLAEAGDEGAAAGVEHFEGARELLASQKRALTDLSSASALRLHLPMVGLPDVERGGSL